MNENNVNQTPNTEYGYPQSAYPQSGQPFPQSGYPQSGIPYPVSEYGEAKKSKTWQIAIISIVVVLVVALVTTLIVVLSKKNQQNGMMPPPQMGTVISVSANGSMINGQPATIDFFTEAEKAYLKLEDISSTAGYNFEREGNKVKLLSQSELAIMEIGSTNVTLQDQTSKTTTSVEILKAPFEKNGDVYIYARDLSVFLKNTNVSYNSMTGSIEISINAGMGGPGGMPPQGQQPAMAPQQNGTVNNGTQDNSGKEQETTSANDELDARPQPPQGEQGRAPQK